MLFTFHSNTNIEYRDEKRQRIRYKTLAIFLLFLILTTVILIRLQSNKNIEISEICTHNLSVIHDDKGNYFDYVELYNNSNKCVELDNYYLSDDAKNLKKLSLNGKSIKANDYVLVFINKEETGFGLSDNETLYLTNNNNIVCDSVKCKKTKDNESISFIREKNTYEISEPSPLKENKASSIYTYSIEEPSSDFLGGYYDEPFYLSLNSKYEIHYTIDGTIPNENSQLYVEPIYIYDRSDEENLYGKLEEITMSSTVFFNENPTCKGTVVRAVAIDENGVVSNEYTETFFIGLNKKKGFNQLPTISLVVNPDDFFGYENGIYVKGEIYDLNYTGEETDETNYLANYKLDGKGWKRNVKFGIFNEQGCKVDTGSGMIDIHGMWSENFAQKSFNLSLDNHSDFMSEYGYADKTFVLKSTGSADCYETIGSRLRGTILNEIVDGLDFVCQPGNFVQLFLNGEYWGVYYIQPKVDEDYLKKIYNTSTSIDDIEILKGEADNTLEKDKTNNGFTQIMEFSKDWYFSIDSNYEEFSKSVDIDSFIDYYSVEFYVNNTDWPGNNYALFKLKNNEYTDIYDGKYKWYLYDLDDSSGYRYKNNVFTNPFTRDTLNTRYQLLFRLMENKEFREKFKDRFYEISETVFDYNRIEKTVNERFVIYKDSFIESQKRFFDANYNETDFDNEINTFLEFYRLRKNVILDNLETAISYYE